MTGNVIKDVGINEATIRKIFAELGVGHEYLINGRSIVDWWKNGRPSEGKLLEFKQDNPFSFRLKIFNERIKNLVDNEGDPSIIMNEYPIANRRFFRYAEEHIEKFTQLYGNLYPLTAQEFILSKIIFNLEES